MICEKQRYFYCFMNSIFFQKLIYVGPPFKLHPYQSISISQITHLDMKKENDIYCKMLIKK